ncbi:MAG: Do family serine endopeptidase [Alphaproteobacteria bacterium]|nr:Do family serine endopeptidase [Alphaproteobacteria bacterium]
MKKTPLLGVLIALFLSAGLSSGSALAEISTSQAPASFADLADRLLPAVVNISSTQKVEKPDPDMPLPEMPQFPPGSPFEDFFEEFMNKRGMPQGEGGELPSASLGSGFIIDADKGYIVTNNHVVKDAEEVRVTFHDDSTVEAKVVGKDEKMDLAVLKVEPKKKLTAVPFGNSDVLRVGDWVVAIGNPFGLGGTVTAGIISARQRDINSGPYDDFLQTDASINRGNSGGPMFNLNGDVIGINTAIFSPSGGSVGIGFAIPSNLAKPVIDQLIEFGRTRRGWLGVRIQTVTEDIAESIGLPEAKGAMVASVTEGGPAEKANLTLGDVITEFDGKPVPDMRALPRIVAETPIGKTVTLKYWREGKERSSKVTVGELEKAEEDGLLAEAETPETPENQGKLIESVGLSVSPLTDNLRKSFGVPDDVSGVMVTKTETQSEAAEKGLEPGDVIVEIAQQPVSSPAEAQAAFEKALKDKRPSVLLLVNRQGDVRFVAVKPQKTSAKEEKTPPQSDSQKEETQKDEPLLDKTQKFFLDKFKKDQPE